MSSNNEHSKTGKHSIAGQLKLALDELRMQMLGTQVLLGFQFQALFQDAFQSPSGLQRGLSMAAFASLAATFGVLIAATSLHRLAEHGAATARMQRYTDVCTQLALTTFALALVCDVFLIADQHFSAGITALAAGGTALVCWLAWHGLALKLRPRRRRTGGSPMKPGETSLHTRIDYMLTEARVVLPGAQALLGFQFIVTLMQSFESLPHHVQIVHFAGLACVVLAVVGLIAPAAIHRLAFYGEDDDAFLRIASRIVTASLLPLTLGIACEFYVAVYKLFEVSWAAVASAVAAAGLLLILWYVVPLRLRAINGGRRSAAQPLSRSNSVPERNGHRRSRDLSR